MNARKISTAPADVDVWLQKCLHEATLQLDDSGAVYTIESVTRKVQVFSNWTAMILIAGERIHLNFSLHFECPKVQTFCRNAMHLDRESPLRRKSVFDVIKEFCNTVAGNLSNSLNQHSIPAGISIPLLTPGFSHAMTSYDASKEYLYQIASANSHMIACFQIDSEDWDRLSGIDRSGMGVKSGVIELL